MSTLPNSCAGDAKDARYNGKLTAKKIINKPGRRVHKRSVNVSHKSTMLSDNGQLLRDVTGYATGAAVIAASYEGVFSMAENTAAYMKGDKSGEDAFIDAAVSTVQSAGTAAAVAGAATVVCCTVPYAAACGMMVAASPLTAPVAIAYTGYHAVKRLGAFLDYVFDC